jgi:DnaK suppressor protein
VSKPPAKAAAASKTAVKTAKTTTEAVPAKPAAQAAAKVAAPASTVSVAPEVAAKPATAAAKTAASKAAANTAPSQPAPPASPAAPASNRFTDRFAPARHTTRPMTETADLPKTAHKADPKLANAWKTKAGRELTEAELLAMPEDEYMNEKQIDFFRARLQQQKDDLLSNAGETTEHLREDTSIVPDPADRATIEEEHALELRTRDRERKLLKKIAQSLGRLESGDYGFCDETGEPIGLARLMARPTATLSLEAQQRRELKQKMFGD